MQMEHEQSPAVLFELRGDIGVILLNDLSRRNALCVRLIDGVLAALETSKAANARAIVIASSHGIFCAGADIREMLESEWLDKPDEARTKHTPLDLFEAIENDDRPIIAAVEGLALGGGVELILACDLAVAAESTKFSLPEIGLGVIPNTAMARLPALIGARATLELILTRTRFTVERAKALGIISEITPSAELIPRAVELAQTIVQGAPPGAIAAVKHGIERGPDWHSIDASLKSLQPEEWHEGLSSFLEKRTPDYAIFWGKK